MSPWKRWQDWITLIAAVGVLVATVAIGAETAVMTTVTALAIILGAAALVALARPAATVAHWVAVIAGVLLFVAPWVMGYADEAGLAWSSWIGSVLAVVIEGTALPQLRHGGRPQPHG